MALFGTYSSSDFQKIQIWVQSIHNELHFHASEQSKVYGFDFHNDTPHDFSHKFKWEPHSKNTQYTKRSLFNRSTASALDIDEFPQVIPDIFIQDQ